MAQARNPYIAGNPVGGSAAFVGRDDVLRAVQRVLGDPQHHGIVLFGQRRIGKTSILKHLAAWLPRNGGTRAIYFDLQDKAARPVGAILVDLAGKIAAALDLPDPEPVGDAEAWFRDRWLPPVLGGLPEGESLVVLLDEFDVLADAESAKAASASFFGYLRELLERVAPRLRLVFVIGRNLEELSYLVGPLFKALPKEHVSLLAEGEAEDVARLSEKNGSLGWSGEAVQKVWELTHGHPYLLQHLCWQVWQRAHEGGLAGRAVGAEDVEGAAPATIDASGNALEWLWGGLPPAAKVVAAALAKAGGGIISEKQLVGTLKGSGVRVLIRELRDAPELLVKWDIVEPVEGGHRFRVEMLRRWIARNKPPLLVQRELDHIQPLAEALYKTGEGYYKTGDLDSALEQLQKSMKLNPNHRRASELAVEILEVRGVRHGRYWRGWWRIIRALRGQRW